MSRTRLSIVGCFLALSMATAPIRLSGFVGVDRGELLFALVPGQGGAAIVTVTNGGTERSSVSLSIGDFAIVNGRPDFDSQPHERGLATRLTAFPLSFDLDAGEAREVQVLLDSGDEPFERGTHWAVVFVQTFRLADMAPPGGGRPAGAGAGDREGRRLCVRRCRAGAAAASRGRRCHQP